MQKTSFQDVVKSINRNKVHKSYELYKRRLKLTLERKTAGHLLFVGGGAGIGKSYAVFTTAKELGIEPERIRPANPQAFVEDLAEAAKLRKPVIILDDVGSILTSSQTAELIKMGWDRNRTITWRNLNTERPTQFKINSVLVWLSNANLTKETPPAMRANLDALESRGGHQIWIEGSDKDKLDYTVWLATEGGMLKKLFVSKKSSEDAINYFITNRNRLKEISPRTLGNIAKEIHSGISKRDLGIFLTDAPVRDITGFGQLKLIKPDVWKEAA